MGSSVPACPTRRVPSARRTRATTSWLVGPDGLSATMPPCTGSLIAQWRLVYRIHHGGTEARRFSICSSVAPCLRGESPEPNGAALGEGAIEHALDGRPHALGQPADENLVVGRFGAV